MRASGNVTLIEVPPDWRSAPPPGLSPILEAALDAFNEHSYRGTSVRDIAGRVGVTVPALYYHHKNKEAILFALLDASIDHLTNLCNAAISEAGEDAVLAFLNLVECISLYMTQVRKLALLDSEIRSLSPTLRQIYSEKRRQIEHMLLHTLERGVEQGIFDVRSPRDTARALLGMYQAIPVWYRAEGKSSPNQIVMTYLEISANTVGASASVFDRIRGRE